MAWEISLRLLGAERAGDLPPRRELVGDQRCQTVPLRSSPGDPEHRLRLLERKGQAVLGRPDQREVVLDRAGGRPGVKSRATPRSPPPRRSMAGRGGLVDQVPGFGVRRNCCSSWGDRCSGRRTSTTCRTPRHVAMAFTAVVFMVADTEAIEEVGVFPGRLRAGVDMLLG